MRRILAGVETEYGLHVGGRGAEEQINDAIDFVRGYPGECFVGWDYRFESPRSDLRGFRLESLAFDPKDAEFDRGKSHGPSSEVRSDRVLPNGGRFYNDHGHPEYSTPETLSLFELALHDRAGQEVMLRAAAALSENRKVEVKVFKNNTDFHGASYGTHEGYLAPRSLGYQRLYDAVLPLLVARQVLTGSGKVGAESGRTAAYQLSQRADFFAEPANAETLFRRPIFNTRDEPHADPRQWIRLHVISGDANMIPSATARKVGLVKLAIALAEANAQPVWKLADPVRAFQEISRDETLEFRVELSGKSWTTAGLILESYFAAAEAVLELDEEMKWLIESSRQLLINLYCDPAKFRSQVDWAAKRYILEQFMDEEGTDWRDPGLRAYDLEYHNPDPDSGLYHALVEMDIVASEPSAAAIAESLTTVREPTRARARSIAVRKFRDELETVSWGNIVFRSGHEVEELPLPPDVEYPPELESCKDVGTFIEMVRGLK